MVSLNYLLANHEALHLVIEIQRDAHRFGGVCFHFIHALIPCFAREEGILQEENLHVRLLCAGEGGNHSLVELLGRRIEELDGPGWIEIGTLKAQAVFVIERQDLFLAVDGGPTFGVPRMDGDQSHGMPAFDPAAWAEMVALMPRNPDVVIAHMNPAAGVADGPVVGVEV